jgi:hypothetical protein
MTINAKPVQGRHRATVAARSGPSAKHSFVLGAAAGVVLIAVLATAFLTRQVV